MNKKIAILGATGSVGTQALDVAEARGYDVRLISAHRDVDSAERIARKMRPEAVAMTDERAARDLAVRLADLDIRVLAGADALIEAVAESDVDTVVNSIIGSAGLMPTLATLRSGKRLALANKESLVASGEIVKAAAKESGAELIPVDSEHSAIFQSLKSGRPSEVKRILLTASGGPFFGYSSEDMKRVTLADTLRHPTWKMGRRITVDSATLMNKGFEVIEAYHLFDVAPENISVVIHRESILHSAVEYIDNTVIGEMSTPDMRMCVEYAVDYPDRKPSVSRPLDLFAVGKLTFSPPDTDAFPLLSLAYRALEYGGAVPAVLNAADEVAVGAFLDSHLAFSEISEVVAETVERLSSLSSVNTLDGIFAADSEARRVAQEIVNGKKRDTGSH